MSLMHPARSRLVCHAHNAFKPSIALWQHFVLPNRPFLLPQRLSSTASAAIELSNAPDTLPETPSAPSDQDAPSSPPRSLTMDRLKSLRTIVREAGLSPDSAASKGIIRILARQASKEHERRKMEALDRQLEQTPTEFMLQAQRKFLHREDYEGTYMLPAKPERQIPEFELPWVVKRDNDMTGAQRLAKEMALFEKFIRPNEAEKRARRHIMSKARQIALGVLPKYLMEPFGSQATGLAFALSDIDLRLRPQDDKDMKLRIPSKDERGALQAALYRLKRKYNADQKDTWTKGEILHARYPLLEIQHMASGLTVQIVSANDTSEQRKIIKQYQTEFLYLTRLYCTIKTIFDIRGLSNVFRGGFGSYAILMMIVAALKHNPPTVKNSVGGLVSFLDFWGRFDTTTQGISLEPAEFFDKAETPVISKRAQTIQLARGNPLPAYMLCLRDPADHRNDLGRKGSSIKHVQETCHALSIRLAEDMAANTRDSLLAPLVGEVVALTEAQRAKLAPMPQPAIRKVMKPAVRKVITPRIRKIVHGTHDKIVDEVIDEELPEDEFLPQVRKLERRELGELILRLPTKDIKRGARRFTPTSALEESADPAVDGAIVEALRVAEAAEKDTQSSSSSGSSVSEQFTPGFVDALYAPDDLMKVPGMSEAGELVIEEGETGGRRRQR
ncbi:hypothetical protein P154DRAFT_619439 [Amniculicola lignicola CBS 123094]|uniref:polynucleotide adenylyltransferase n=1 Tax=Amniculicola lignicola CBS 123094 TaxID=1392246 RepID=A0A6A5WK68_9PLEO|nr:hypothetical protein P154DRAFT_619439 [Amniculicola lignicola CBS 123094]